MLMIAFVIFSITISWIGYKIIKKVRSQSNAFAGLALAMYAILGILRDMPPREDRKIELKDETKIY